MRLIDADALPIGELFFNSTAKDLRNGIVRMINESPTVDAEPVHHGEWNRIGYDIYECSVCGQNIMTSDIDCYKFCHGCGSRMDGEE